MAGPATACRRPSGPGIERQDTAMKTRPAFGRADRAEGPRPFSHPITRCAATLAGVVCLSAPGARAQIMTGHIYWTDGEGTTHAARHVRVETFGSGPMTSGQTGMVYTDLDGMYTSVYGLPA